MKSENIKIKKSQEKKSNKLSDATNELAKEAIKNKSKDEQKTLKEQEKLAKMELKAKLQKERIDKKRKLLESKSIIPENESFEERVIREFFKDGKVIKWWDPKKKIKEEIIEQHRTKLKNQLEKGEKL